MLHLTTAGHSHGKYIIAILEGLPSGFKINVEKIKLQLQRRKFQEGRSRRQEVEDDYFEFSGGVTDEYITTGAPLGIILFNKVADYNRPEEEDNYLMPGHIDGPYYFRTKGELSPYWGRERGSARETAVRTIAGAICRQYLEALGVNFFSLVKRVGEIFDENTTDFKKLSLFSQQDPFLWHYDRELENKFKDRVVKACSEGDTLGGEGELWITGLPPGIGYLSQFPERLTARIAQVLFSIPSVKKVSWGEETVFTLEGSSVVDEFLDKKSRKSNFSGGVEAGFTTGMPLKINLGIKPVPTQKKREVDVYNIEKRNVEKRGFTKRADCCIIKSVLVIAENLVALELLNAILSTINGSSFSMVNRSFFTYKNF